MPLRLSLYPSEERLRELFKITHISGEYRMRYNIAPGQPVSVLVNDGDNRVAYLHWGLIPKDARHASLGISQYQLRQEAILDSQESLYRLKEKRCVVLADGFFLWRKSNEGAQPWYFHLSNNMPFGLAAIWDTWISDEGEPIHSCAVISTRPNELVEPVHHRMPVMLTNDGVNTWIDRNKTDAVDLLNLCVPCPARIMEAYKVSSRVDRENEDSSEVIQPVL